MAEGTPGVTQRGMDLAARLAGASLHEALRTGTSTLATVDASTAAVDARRLLIFITGGDALHLVRSPEQTLTDADASHYGHALCRRLRGEPVSRIIGTKGFYGREFIVTSATLDPRPESETLIDVALDCLSTRYPDGAGLEILDIGTGSGCLLITLLAQWPLARGTGIDLSPQALAIAARNAATIGVADRCTWIEGSAFANVARSFDLIVTNPPYIPTNEIKNLARDVRDHDPRLALDGGADGLDVYRLIASRLAPHVNPAGLALFEVGDEQAAAVVELISNALPRNRCSESRIDLDMAAKPRCVSFMLR